MESWAGVAIFFAIAFILFILVIARTVYRAFFYRDCCRSCKKRAPAADPKNTGIHSISAELQAINDQQRASVELETSGGALRRNSSQTFDPLTPDSLVLPTHGIHFPEPGEEVKGEDIPTGGHNQDFFIANVGYDEPDKGTPPSFDEVRGKGIAPPVQESKEHNVQINGNVPSVEISVQDPQSSGNATPSEESKNGNVVNPVPESDSRQDATPSQESGYYQDLIKEGPVPANEHAALVIKDETEVENGVENPLEIEDSYEEPILV